MFNNFVKWLKTIKKKTGDKLSIYKALAYLANQIKEDNFVKIYNPMYSLVDINTIYPNINEYTQGLKLFISKTSGDIYIPVFTVANTIEHKSLRDWFIVNDSYSIPIESIIIFKNTVIEFIELYEHYDNTMDKTYNQNKNLNTYRPVINNLFILLEDLKNV